MAKKAKVKRAKAIKQMKYTCNSCGVVLSVDNACSCDPCDVICCGENMKLSAC